MDRNHKFGSNLSKWLPKCITTKQIQNPLKIYIRKYNIKIHTHTVMLLHILTMQCGDSEVIGGSDLKGTNSGNPLSFKFYLFYLGTAGASVGWSVPGKEQAF